MQEILNTQPSKVNFNFSTLQFIDPSGVVTLWNMVELIESKHGCDIFYVTPRGYRTNPRFYKAVDYLDDSLFFEKVMGEKLHPGSKERSTTNGLEKLHTGKFNQSYISKTIDWLKYNISLQDKSFSFLETVFSELFNNINDHSMSPVGGCVFAQHYPQNNEITLCISDAGKGIAKSMSEKFTFDANGKKLDKDWLLIDYATHHKVSTKSKPGNRGLGLENLLAIMKSNKGSIKIVSNNGVLEYNYANSPERKKNYSSTGYYQGTLVLLSFRTDTLEPEEEEDLEWF